MVEIKWIPGLGIVDESPDRAGIHFVRLLELGHGSMACAQFSYLHLDTSFLVLTNLGLTIDQGLPQLTKSVETSRF